MRRPTVLLSSLVLAASLCAAQNIEVLPAGGPAALDGPWLQAHGQEDDITVLTLTFAPAEVLLA